MSRIIKGLICCAFCVVLTLGLNGSAAAQGGPPMITDDTGTTPKHHYEINTAFTIERGEDGTVYGVPLVDFNYGITKNAQIKVEIPWLVLHNVGERSITGLGNTNIGVRYRFRDEDEKHRVALSIYPQFEFNNPVGSVRRGLVDKGPEFLMPLQWETAIGKWGVGGDVGYRFKRGEDEVIYGVIAGREFKRFELMGEIHGTGGRRHLSSSEVVYNFGTRVPVTKHATLLLSGGRSIRPHRDPQFIGYAGVGWTF